MLVMVVAVTELGTYIERRGDCGGTNMMGKRD